MDSELKPRSANATKSKKSVFYDTNASTKPVSNPKKQVGKSSTKSVPGGKTGEKPMQVHDDLSFGSTLCATISETEAITASLNEKQAPVLPISPRRTCACPENHLNCLTAKQWIKNQLGVWQFTYNGRDVRDKKLHPATFPIALARRVIELFTHQGELVLDPFVGSGTTLVAAQEANRNAAGFDLSDKYVALSKSRLGLNLGDGSAVQMAIQDDARNIPRHFAPGVTARLIFTSPPYANLLNRARLNKSRRDRKNDQYLKVEQYSQDPRDLGTLCLEDYAREMESIFRNLLLVLEPGGHCVINVPDVWWNDSRVTIHLSVIEALRRAGYEFRNTIIWDRTNIVNKIGIFGWPRNYITMGTTFEYILHFRKPPNSVSETKVN